MNKPNERHERFCREYVRRPVGSAAALAAGYSEDNAAAQACRLLARPDIQVRIAELRDEVAARQCGDVSAVLARLQVIYELAIEQNQFSTALRAVALQLRVSGMVPEGRGGTRRAGPDYGAMLSEIAGMADLAPPATEPVAAPDGSRPEPCAGAQALAAGQASEHPGSAAEMPRNANKSQSNTHKAATRGDGSLFLEALLAGTSPLPGLPADPLADYLAKPLAKPLAKLSTAPFAGGSAAAVAPAAPVRYSSFQP